jgi:hypothetical protein
LLTASPEYIHANLDREDSGGILPSPLNVSIN